MFMDLCAIHAVLQIEKDIFNVIAKSHTHRAKNILGDCFRDPIVLEVCLVNGAKPNSDKDMLGFIQCMFNVFMALAEHINLMA